MSTRVWSSVAVVATLLITISLWVMLVRSGASSAQAAASSLVLTKEEADLVYSLLLEQNNLSQKFRDALEALKKSHRCPDCVSVDMNQLTLRKAKPQNAELEK